ncbi:MAG: ribosome biogenesis GTPase YlqF, partial [Clostridia bacterium]|nr:ribosome biogenesis GTPase YlqF [Clostridia bacterium]
LNKEDLADPEKNALWKEHFLKEGLGVVLLDCKSGKGLQSILAESRRLLADKIRRDREKGMTKPIRAMVVGIPNVGKSTMINRFAGTKKAQAENRPGVTKQKQWVKVGPELELLDMPGVLWPKFEDVVIGENLAITGAIKDAILQSEEIACKLCERLMEIAPKELMERFKLSENDLSGDAYDLFCAIGRKRGMLISGGEINEERCAAMLLEEFRNGKIGRITLEEPK